MLFQFVSPKKWRTESLLFKMYKGIWTHYYNSWDTFCLNTPQIETSLYTTNSNSIAFPVRIYFLLRNGDDLYLFFPIRLLCFIFVEFHSWQFYHSIHITLIVNVGYGVKSIVRTKAILPNRFVRQLDDTLEDTFLKIRMMSWWARSLACWWSRPLPRNTISAPLFT